MRISNSASRVASPKSTKVPLPGGRARQTLSRSAKFLADGMLAAADDRVITDRIEGYQEAAWNSPKRGANGYLPLQFGCILSS